MLSNAIPPSTQVRLSRPQFQGEHATREARQKFLTEDELNAALQVDGDSYLGRIPEDALHAAGREESEVLDTLDTVTEQLQQLDSCQLLQTLRPIRMLDRFMDAKLQKAAKLDLEAWQEQHNPFKDDGPMRYLGAGFFGMAVAFFLGDKEHAVKIGFPMDKSMPFFKEEAANGIFFSDKEISDCAKVHAANPMAQWMLMERIGKGDRAKQRSGKTLREAGYRFDDDRRRGFVKKNRVQGILVDFGGEVFQKTQIGRRTVWVPVRGEQSCWIPVQNGNDQK
jgi:hypothetical protein